MTRSESISIILPKPLHFEQAPTGELNENADGVAGENLTPLEGDRRPS